MCAQKNGIFLHVGCHAGTDLICALWPSDVVLSLAQRGAAVTRRQDACPPEPRRWRPSRGPRSVLSGGSAARAGCWASAASHAENSSVSNPTTCRGLCRQTFPANRGSHTRRSAPQETCSGLRPAPQVSVSVAGGAGGGAGGDPSVGVEKRPDAEASREAPARVSDALGARSEACGNSDVIGGVTRDQQREVESCQRHRRAHARQRPPPCAARCRA